MRRFGIAVLAVLILSPLAAAGRDDDFDFARGLMERKYYDLAKEQFEKILNDPSATDDQQAAGELGLAILLKAQADDARGDPKLKPEDVLKLFADAQARFDKFLESFPNHPKQDVARFQVGSLLHGKGLYLRDLMKKDPEKAAEYRSAAESAFDQAIDLFRAAAELLERKADKDPEADWAARRAHFFELVAHYEKGMIYEAGSAERQGVLQKAATMAENFIWENEENIFGGYAYMYWGLIMKGLDEPESAMLYLKTCADLPVPDPKVDGTASYLNWTDLFMKAYWKLGEYANELAAKGQTDQLDVAVAQIENMQKRIPDCWERQFGHRALLAMARSLMGLKRYGEAQNIVARISQKGDEIGKTKEWGQVSAFLANQLLNEIITAARIGGEELTVSPGVQLKAALGKKAARQWGAAIRAFQGVVTAAKSPEEVEQFAKQAWMDIGECYYRSNRFMEAYFTYDLIEKKFDGEEVAGEAAYYRYRAITARYADTNDPRDLALKKAARKTFATKYKDHPRAIDLQYYEGADLISDGDAARIAGDEKTAMAAYDGALKRLTATKKSSILYAKAQARIGEVYYKEKKIDEALAKFSSVLKFVSNPRNVTTDPQRQANRLQASAIATFFSARCRKEQKKWTEVIRILDGFEKKFADENVRNFHAPVKFERMRAYLETGDLDNGEKQLLGLQAESPNADQLPLALSMVSRAYESAAKKAKGEEKEEDWARWLTKAADYYMVYLDLRSQRDPSRKASWGELQRAGNWYHELGNYEKAEPLLEEAYNILAAVIEKTADPAEKERLKKQADSLLQKLAEILLAQKKYAEAKGKLEALLVPDPAARKRVLEMLLQKEFTQVTLNELLEKMRAIPSLMEGLARTYMYVGGADDLKRALKLIQVLAKADKGNKYTKIGWNRNLLLCRIYLQYGRDYRDQAALENVVTLVNQWETLGILKNSGMPEKFTALRAEAMKLLGR